MKTVTALQAGLATALVLAAIAAAADPMRPLAQPVKAGAGSDAATATRATPAVPAIGRLVAIREDSRGQRQALIGERWLSVGDCTGGLLTQPADSRLSAASSVPHARAFRVVMAWSSRRLGCRCHARRRPTW